MCNLNFFNPVIQDKNILTILTINAPQKAGQNPSIRNPRFNGEESFAVKSNISVFITRVNKPSVNRINGNVNTVIIGFIKVFTIPKTSPTMIIFHHCPVKSIPSTILTAMAIDKAFIIILKIKYAIFNILQDK